MNELIAEFVAPKAVRGATITIMIPDNVSAIIHGGTWNASYRGDSREEIVRLRTMRRLAESKIRNSGKRSKRQLKRSEV